jgi:hypothetical protein
VRRARQGGRGLVEAHHAASGAQAALPTAVLARHGIDSEQHHAMVDQLARSGSHLHRASLWWVTADMAAVARQAAATLPEWTPSLAAPDERGLLIWADTVGQATWHAPDGPRTVNIAGAGWWHDRGDIHIALLTRSKPIADQLAGSWRASTLFPPADLDLPDLVDDDVRGRDGGDLAQVLGATWLLMRQRVATVEHTSGHPGGSRPQRGQRQRAPQDVAVVELRRPEPQPGDDEPRRVDWTHRWVVSGHWRQQPVGPEGALREPRWIAPHVKGPADKSLREKERINVWRR